MCRIYNVVCYHCNSVAGVDYSLTDSFFWEGSLHVCNGKVYHYYDQNLFNSSMLVRYPIYRQDWDLTFSCRNCYEEFDYFDYIKAFENFEHQHNRFDTSRLNESFRPFTANCASCHYHSEIVTECEITLREKGLICIDDHQKLVFVRMDVNEAINQSSYQYKCCGKVIAIEELSRLRCDDYFRHAVEHVDMFSDHCLKNNPDPVLRTGL